MKTPQITTPISIQPLERAGTRMTEDRAVAMALHLSLDEEDGYSYGLKNENGAWFVQVFDEDDNLMGDL